MNAQYKMMTLYETLGKSKEILQIPHGTDIQNAIKIAFSSQNYKFFLNSELIDVNDRFRIFSLNNNIYIAKKASDKHNNDESLIANKVKNIIGNPIVNGRKVSIVVPNIVEVEGERYILTNYYGHTIQENLYSAKQKNIFYIQDLFSILDILLSKGILYRGLIPRNIIIHKNEIYLIDWEDVVFSNKTNKEQVNIFWATNFLLNWGYFFPMDTLRKKLHKYKNKTINNEPDLLKYEFKIAKLMGFDSSNVIQLRNQIKLLVLEAERPLEEECLDNNSFIIHPHDMAHLISDIYDVNIDVFFDFATYKFRQKNEKMYLFFLQLMTNIILDSYKQSISMKPIVMLPILFLISPILLLEHKSKMNTKSINEFVNYWLNKQYDKNNIIQNYIYADLDLLEQNIFKIIKTMFNDTDMKEKYIDSYKIQKQIVNIILNQSKNFKDMKYVSNI